MTNRDWATDLDLAIVDDEVELFLMTGWQGQYPPGYPYRYTGSVTTLSVAATLTDTSFTSSTSTADGYTLYVNADALWHTNPCTGLPVGYLPRLPRLWKVATNVDDLVVLGLLLTGSMGRHPVKASTIRVLSERQLWAPAVTVAP